jgi:hypothetical protein
LAENSPATASSADRFPRVGWLSGVRKRGPAGSGLVGRDGDPASLIPSEDPAGDLGNWRTNRADAFFLKIFASRSFPYAAPGQAVFTMNLLDFGTETKITKHETFKKAENVGSPKHVFSLDLGEFFNVFLPPYRPCFCFQNNTSKTNKNKNNNKCRS